MKIVAIWGLKIFDAYDTSFTVGDVQILAYDLLVLLFLCLRDLCPFDNMTDITRIDPLWYHVHKTDWRSQI